MATPLYDPENLQGNVLAGFNTDHQTFLALTRDADAEEDRLRDWCRAMADRVTSDADVRSGRRPMKDPDRNGAMTWLGLGLGHGFVTTLRSDVVFKSFAYVDGFRKRARGIMRDQSPPEDWQVGGDPAREVDALLIVAGNEADAVRDAADRHALDARAAGLREVYRKAGRRLDGDREHFGFRDGIAQPVVAAEDGRAGQPLGQFVFGYPAPGPGQSEPLLAGQAAEFGVDGTFLVFRQLDQDVPAFRRFCGEQAEALAADWPGLTAAHVAALIVGRWPDGQLVDASGDGPGPLPADLDDFDFGDDVDGRACPFAAHIRKVNPRSGGGDLSTPAARRFLRHGIPFGPPLREDTVDARRGLLFVAVATSIEEQVDFVTARWMNSALRPNAGSDLLVGLGHGGDGPPGRLVAKRGGRDHQIVAERNAWVVPSGGAYLYVPGRTALRALAELPSGAVGWRLRSTGARLVRQARRIGRTMRPQD